MSAISVTKVASRILLSCKAPEGVLRYRRCVRKIRTRHFVARILSGLPVGLCRWRGPEHAPGFAPLDDYVAERARPAPCRSALRRPALLLHGLLRTLFQFRRRDVLDVCAEEPAVACRILHAAAAVAIELVRRL